MKGNKLILYVVISMIFFGAAFFIIPQISRSMTNRLYKAEIKKSNAADDEDIDIEIVKKTEED